MDDEGFKRAIGRIIANAEEVEKRIKRIFDGISDPSEKQNEVEES